MQDLSLEKEFELYKWMHMTTILQAKITVYYRNLQDTGIKIPEFMTVPAEKLAEKEVLQLMCYNPKTFESLYKQAWNEYAECLP